MFCRKCKAEYRDGFKRCADCRLALVSQLPLRSQDGHGMSNPGMRVAHTTHDEDDCVFFCKDLIAADIPFKVDETNRQYLRDVERTFVVRVPPKFFKKARRILDDRCIAEGPADDDE